MTFYELGETWTLDNEAEVAQNLVWFDSRDPDGKATAVDARGREAELFVEESRVRLIRLKTPSA